MKIGNINISNLKLGTVQIKKVFSGLDLVWTSFLSIINDFKSRVLANQGKFEGETCLNDTLEDIGIDLFDQASLVITPNGYEETKLFSVVPNNDTGDLTVTRATIATRVNDTNLVEFVPYNIFNRSEEFENSYWIKQGTSVASNSIEAPDGTMTADSITGTSGRTYSYTGLGGVATNIVSSAFTTRNEVTVSFYLKYKGLNRIRVMYGNTTSINTLNRRYLTVDLENGIITDNSENITNPFIESVGEGWYRVGFSSIMDVGTTNNRFAVGLGDTTKTIADGVDGVYMWGAQLVDGIQAKEYFRVTNGFNVPRIDYIYGDECPTLLTEPQLTNSWTNNNITSGYTNNTNAIQVATIPNAFGEGFNGFDYNFSSGTFLAASFSIRQFDTRGFPIQRLCFFVKNPSSDFFGINYGNATQVIYQFSTLTARDYYGFTNTGTITKINENTYALYLHMDNTTTGQFSQVRVGFVGDITSQVPITGSAILGLGYQQGVASGSTLPLTYNPITTGASSVTKNAETLTKVGVENLIGQTEGTLLVKGYQFDRGIVLRIRNSGSTTLNRIAIFCASNDGKVECAITKNGTAVNSTVLTSPSVFKKNIAFVYSNLGFKVFINGAIIFTHTYATQTDFTAVLNELNLGSVSERATARFELVALWKTQLTDEQVIQLTTL
jgi:hypothetical protein